MEEYDIKFSIKNLSKFHYSIESKFIESIENDDIKIDLIGIVDVPWPHNYNALCFHLELYNKTDIEYNINFTYSMYLIDNNDQKTRLIYNNPYDTLTQPPPYPAYLYFEDTKFNENELSNIKELIIIITNLELKIIKNLSSIFENKDVELIF